MLFSACFFSACLLQSFGRRRPPADGPYPITPKECVMNRAELTEKILDVKREKGWTWKHICGEIGGMSPMLVAGALLGQMKLTKLQVAKAAELFGLSKGEQA